MAKQYSLTFKKNCVQKLNDLKAKGIVVINKVEVKNVRELVKALGVSNDSLYTWAKLYPRAEIEKSDISDDFFDEKDIEISTQLPGEKKEIFNQRYLGWMAGILGIKYYSNMLIPQLKVAIGNELIKQSGLVDMKKASKNLKKNGEGL